MGAPVVRGSVAVTVAAITIGMPMIVIKADIVLSGILGSEFGNRSITKFRLVYLVIALQAITLLIEQQ